MPNVSGNTLVLVIQAVDFKMADLEHRLDALPSDRGGELEALLFDYENAAHALKQAYQEALAEADNLPPYEQLVRGD